MRMSTPGLRFPILRPGSARMARLGWIPAAVLALTASACSGSDRAETKAPSGPPLAVTTTVAAVAENPDRLEAGGVVAAGTSAMMTSRVVAPVLDLRVRAGDRVRAGQVLVVLDDRDLGAVARQAQAAAAAAEQGLSAARSDEAAAAADLELATAWQGRVAGLHERRSATPQELDEANARLASARARAQGTQARIAQAGSQVAAARAAADAAGTTHAFATIRAPFDGLVTETLTDPGNLASPGVPLLRLESFGAPQVEVTVDESRVASVHPGDRVQVLFDAGGAVDGTVTEVGRAVAADARAFTVKVSLPKDADVRSGTFARVRFRGPMRRSLHIPLSAIRRQGQIASVFVVQDNVARLRLIQTGAAGDESVEVLAGLEVGEVIVTRPPLELTDGRSVTARPAPAGAGR